MAIDKKQKQVKAGRIADAKKVLNQKKRTNAASEYFVVRVQFEKNVEKTLLFTQHEITRAINRAKKNPEDCPEVGVLRNLFD
jgi:hypothetical protein